MKIYKLWQYPRGVNKGGVLNTEICPTISTSSWENNCLLIEIDMEETNKTICLNSKVDGKQPSTSQRIYDSNGVSMAITASFLPSIAEPTIGAMRGRNPDNPNERKKSNGKYKQRLEMNENGISNTLTSVYKDNVVVEPKVVNPLKGQTMYGWHFEQAVYNENGITRALKAGGGSGNTPKVQQVGNLYPDTEDFKNRTMGRVYSEEGISPTINCCGGGDREPKLKVPQATAQGYAECELGGVFDASYPNSTTRRGRVQDGGKISPTLTSEGEPLNRWEGGYRIRKLTPRECFRLMDVDEHNIDKIQNYVDPQSGKPISNSQQYKMAGNSIVVNCMYHIFRTLFCETENPDLQLTIFDML